MARNLHLARNNPDSQPDVAGQYVVFLMDEQRYALALTSVIRIVRAVEITHLPDAPDIVLGVINVEGEVLPVLSLRRRLLLPERELGPQHQFLIANMRGRQAALVIDEAQEVMERKQSEIVASDVVVPGLDHIQGMIKLDDGMVLIHDLEMLLSFDEVLGLQKSMEKLQ